MIKRPIPGHDGSGHYYKGTIGFFFVSLKSMKILHIHTFATKTLPSEGFLQNTNLCSLPGGEIACKKLVGLPLTKIDMLLIGNLLPTVT